MPSSLEFPRLTALQFDNLGEEFLSYGFSSLQHPYPIELYRQVIWDAIIQTNPWYPVDLNRKFKLVETLTDNKVIEYVVELTRYESHIYSNDSQILVDICQDGELFISM